MVVIMNNMNQFQPFESKLERVGGFFGALFMASMVLPIVILAVFEGVCKVFQAVDKEAAARQADKRS